MDGKFIKLSITIGIFVASTFAYAREVERDRIECTFAKPINVFTTAAAGGAKMEQVTKITIQENYNHNYSTVIINNKELGSQNYRRTKGGQVVVYPDTTNVSLTMRPDKRSALLQSGRVSAAYAHLVGKAIVQDTPGYHEFQGSEIEIDCNLTLVKMN